jgi:uncharacterized membrane protein YfcA
MSLVLPVNEAVAVLLPMLITTDIIAVSVHWRRWNAELLLRLLPAAVVGVLISTYVITTAPSIVLRRIMSAVILAIVTYKLLEKHTLQELTYQSQPWHGPAAGLTSGLLSGLAHSGGPPISMYLLLEKVQPRTFAATAALYFAILNLTKAPFYLHAHLFNPEQIAHTLWASPLLAVGVLLGRQFSTRIKREPFENIILGLLVVASLLLLLPT